MKNIKRLLFFVGFLILVLIGCQISDDLLNPASAPTFAVFKTQSIAPIEESDITNTGESDDLPGRTRVVFSDDFSSTTGGWKTANFVEGSTGYFNEGFRILLNRPKYLLWSTAGKDYEDVRLDVDVSLIGGGEDNSFGMICRYQDARNFYAFLISSDGYYAIRKRVEGGFLNVIGERSYQLTNQIFLSGQENHLSVECDGIRLRLYVNGSLLAEVIDSDFSYGDVGLIAGTFSADTTNLFFDNFVAAPVD